MAKDLFEVESGLSIDDNVHILYGTTDPFINAEAMLAPLGSSYSNIVAGSQYTRTSTAGLATDWVELAGKELAIVINGVNSTGVILDQVPVKLVDSFAWEVTAFNEATPTDKIAILIHMSHDGTSTQPATDIKHSISNTIKHGKDIDGVQIVGTLTGTAPDQMMSLYVSSNVPTTFIAIRMIKNLAGSNTLVIGAASLENHILDKTVHLTAWQNTLLDGLDQTMTSNELNYVKGVTSNIQSQINALIGDLVGVKTFTGAVTCNYVTDGSYIAATVTGATTLTITGVPDSTKAYGMTFELTNAGTNITWPSSVTWLGTTPTLRASGVSMVTLVTRNGGATWYGSAA